MKNNIQRVLALVVCLALCFSLNVPAYAIGESNTLGVTFSVVLDTPKITVNSNDAQQVVMRLMASKPVTVDGIGFTVTKPDDWTIVSISGGDTLGAYDKSATNVATGKAVWSSLDSFDGENVENVTELAVITFSVPATATVNTYEVGVKELRLSKDYTTDEWETAATASTILTIETPAEEKTGYEVFYVLKDAEGNEIPVDSDRYTNFGVNDTVTAEIFMASHSGNVTLQAYDIYLTYSDALVYQGEEMAGTAYVSGATYDKVAAAEEKISHITLVDGKTTIDLSSTPVSLGTVTFKINPDVTTNGDQLAIALTQAKDTTANTDKQENVTNFSVGTDAAGNKESYYPAVGGDVLGVEVDQTWTITWNNDDGTELKETTVEHGYVPAYGEENPTKADDTEHTYSFNGWEPELKKATADATYTATYTEAAREYTVTYETEENGTLDGNLTEQVAYGSKPQNVPAANANTGYAFVGWFDKTTGEEVDLATFTVTGDVTLVAKYEKITLTITFHANGGTGTSGDTYTQEVPYGEEITLMSNAFAAPENATFKNWNTQADGKGTTYGDNALLTITENLDLYAQWAMDSYIIDNDGNQYVSPDKSAAEVGEDVTVSVTVPAGYTLDEVTITDSENHPVNYEEVDGKYVFQMPASDVKVTATFTPNEYTVTLDHNYEGSTDGQLTVTYDSTYTGLTDPSREGYTFAGWFTEDDVKVDANTKVTIVGDHELHAEWTANEYKVTLDNEGVKTEITVTYDDTYENLPEPTKPGYTFDGWYTEDDELVEKDDTVKITDNDTVLNAKWSPTEYTITFVDTDGTTIKTLTYTIESDAVLGDASKDNHTFVNWILAADTEGWSADTYFKTDVVTDKWGNVTLVAQWDVGFTYAIENYAYAQDGYVMLRIAVTSNSTAYKFGEYEMYYTDSEEYKLSVGTEKLAVFVTLIPMSMAEEDENGTLVLKEGNASLWAESGDEVKTIDRDGDVNGDGVTNIADANIVYQMLEHEAHADYYNNLETLDRLEADVYTATVSGDMRGTTLDVHWIVNMINGVENTSTDPNA